MFTVIALASLFVGASAIDASTASAFCRESLASQSQAACDPNPGVPFLFWQRSCVTYKFNDQLFTRINRLSETDIRHAFSKSFAAWAAVDCVGGNVTADTEPFQVEQFGATTPTAKAEFLYDGVNESVVLALTGGEWSSLPDHDGNALALTLLWHDKNTGQILDVDMELNTGAGDFYDCVANPCNSFSGKSPIDLQNTITHEGGHLLGLGHSLVAGSTMEAQTTVNSEVSKRMLKTDDKEGYCSLDLPRFKCNGSDCSCPAPPIISSKGTVKSCNCRTVGAVPGIRASGMVGSACVVFAFMARGRRRQRQRRRH